MLSLPVIIFTSILAILRQRGGVCKCRPQWKFRGTAMALLSLSHPINTVTRAQRNFQKSIEIGYGRWPPTCLADLAFEIIFRYLYLSCMRQQ